MTQKELTDFFEIFVNIQREIMADKGSSYSGATDAQSDRLANFKRVSKQMGVTPMQTWLCYFLKHVDSVCTYVRTGHESEGFESRALDLANYAILGAALVAEDKRPEPGVIVEVKCDD